MHRGRRLQPERPSWRLDHFPCRCRSLNSRCWRTAPRRHGRPAEQCCLSPGPRRSPTSPMAEVINGQRGGGRAYVQRGRCLATAAGTFPRTISACALAEAASENKAAEQRKVCPPPPARSCAPSTALQAVCQCWYCSCGGALLSHCAALPSPPRPPPMPPTLPPPARPPCTRRVAPADAAQADRRARAGLRLHGGGGGGGRLRPLPGHHHRCRPPALRCLRVCHLCLCGLLGGQEEQGALLVSGGQGQGQ